MIEVSIVSGTYNRLSHLQRMIASVRASVKGVTYEIILVDGGSTDGTLAWCRQQADIRLIEHGALLGAIKAYDDGAAAARGTYVVFGNDDLTFVGDAIRQALAFMYQYYDTGIGLFYTNRGHRNWHLAEMPAHYPDGRGTNVQYNGIIITPRWLGDQLHWWALPGARTYGGDCALIARCLEAGWPVRPIPDARVDEPDLGDALKTVNVIPTSNAHPDVAAYLRAFPSGPELGHARQFDAPARIRRILYAPIYEAGHQVQHEQKRGLRRALQRIGVVREVDYQTVGPDAILKEAAAFRPDLVLTQLHYAAPFTPEHAARLRQMLPKAIFVNWNGDVYDRSGDEAYLQTLRPFDLHTVVNADAIPSYQKAGIQTRYWQVGYEPDGVGHKPTIQTPCHDVVLLANGYRAERHALGDFLHALPYQTGIYGDYWPGGYAKPSTLYDFRAGCRLYQNAKLAIGDSGWDKDGGQGFTSNRLFQAMAAGGCLMLQQWFDGCESMLHLIDGEHLVLWHDFDDLHARLDYYLTHEAARTRIARAGQAKVLRHHSFEARVQQLLGYLVQNA